MTSGAEQFKSALNRSSSHSGLRFTAGYISKILIGELDLVELGFDGASLTATERPSYHPAVMLKLYLYGYLNRIQSNRRLERECQHNVELMWLIARLPPTSRPLLTCAVRTAKAFATCAAAS